MIPSLNGLHLNFNQAKTSNHYYYHLFAATIQDNLHLPAPQMGNGEFCLSSFAARMLLLTAASAFGLGRRC